MTPRQANTRDALLDAAQDLLDQGGQAAVTLREVGNRAGVSHNAPYKHFRNKEALLAAIAARELNRWGAALEQALRREPTADRALAEALKQQAADAVAFPERARLIYGRWTTATDELVEAAVSDSTLMTETVRAAQRAGRLPDGDPERLTAMLRAVSRGAAELQSAGHLSPDGKGHTDAAGLVESLFEHLADSVRTPEPLS